MGFYSPSEIQQHTQIINKPQSCLTCGLYKTTTNRKMPVTGEGKKDILIIGSHNTFADDRHNNRFLNHEGTYIRDLFGNYGYNFDRDVYSLNAVNCVPIKNHEIREPAKNELQSCKPYVDSIIQELKPKHIITLGTLVNEQMWHPIFKKKSHIRWRGTHIPDRFYNAHIHPMLDMEMVMDERKPEYSAVFNRDFENLIWHIEENNKTPLELYPENEDKYVTILYNFKDLKKNLEALLKNPRRITFDYETTGLKPYAAGHKTATISYAVSPVEAYTFPYEWPGFFTPKELKEIKRLWGKVLKHPEIPLVAQNMKYEDVWSTIQMGVQPVAWDFDTMLATHVLDSRTGFAGLKFQTYLQFGRRPYDTGVSKFLKSNGAEFNTIFEAPLDELLMYGGLDSIYTDKYYERLLKILENSEPSALNPDYTEMDAYNMYHNLTLTFSDVEINGIPCDEEYYQATFEELGEKIEEIEEYLYTGEEAQKFKDIYGHTINLKSSQQLGNLFYDVLGYPEILNVDGNRTTDKAALKDIDLKFVKELTKHKKLIKVKDTYVKGYITHSQGNVIHANFSVATTKSHRSSIRSPSMQNVPVRDKEAKKLCRGGLIPSKGWHIGEADWSGIEVAIGCPYHNDPNMIKYVTDPDTDMHRDTAMDLFMLNLSQISKELRQSAKTNFVFPEFYGDYWKQCAESLWDDRYLKTAEEITLKEHLKNNGIYSLDDFEQHVRQMEKIFWYERFPVYKQWRSDQFELYLEQGYIDTYTGFKHRGVLNKKDVANHNIQGEAYRCQAWVMQKMNDRMKAEKYATKIINQIHDSIIFNMHPAEVGDVFHMMQKLGTKSILDHHKWINVPLVIDFELAPMDRPWNEKEDYKLAA
jgi:DNA polymerase-1